MKKALFCIAGTHTQASRIVSDLKLAGFGASDVSVLFPDQQGTKDFAHEHNTKAPEGATVGGVSGGILGGAVGWLVGIGALAIPGLGPFVAAGPILAALGGAAAGGAAGGVVGALVGLGIPEFEAKRYEGKLKDGNILISVHTENSQELDRAKRIYTLHGAYDISSTSEAEAPRRAAMESHP